MKNNLRVIFKGIFTRLDNFIKWFHKINRFGHTYSFTILAMLSFVSIPCILLIEGVENENKFLLMPMLICFFFLLFMMLISLPDQALKYIPKKVKGNSRDFKELFSTFSHRAYLIGITLFSFDFAVLFILIIDGFLESIFNYTVKVDIEDVFFPIITLFTICYFMYHVVIKDLSIKLARARVQLYVACTLTISLIFFIFSFKNIFIPMITWLGVGYSWLTYFLGRIDAEDQN